MKKPAAKRSKFVGLIKLPIRALSLARDYYVRHMVDCGQVARFPGAHGVGSGIGLQRSFSVASSAVSDCSTNRSEDFKELVRVASVRTLAASGGGKVRVLRSKSVGAGIGMGRIEEEEGDDNDDEDETRKLRVDGGWNGGWGGEGGREQKSVVFWRSKSYAVTNKGVAF